MGAEVVGGMREKPGGGPGGKAEYPGIDRFRIVAALLVVAIHTSPLLLVGEMPDYLFTRVVARMGVPFFFAATGFFVLTPQRGADAAPVWRFVRKTALLYGAAILLYLPVNVYAGHITAGTGFFAVLRMVFVDGTAYHLWYLPAAILGVPLVWLLLRGLGPAGATAVAALLYAVGLLGDSYSAVAEGVPALQQLYEGIFAVASYTRNGLFYAPVFLLAGMWARWAAGRLPRRGALAGLVACLAALVAEGLLLYGVPRRHDSMYIALPFCVFFLLVWLAGFRGFVGKRLRDISMLVYLLHPLVIIGVRGVAKPLRLTALLVENSLVHYLVVCVGSLALAVGLCLFGQWLAARRPPAEPAGRTPAEPVRRAWLRVDLAALTRNAKTLAAMLPPGCKLMPAVKAEAYGLGAVPVARALERAGVDAFCVAAMAEGIALRRAGVRGDILVLGYTPPQNAPLLRKWRLMQTVVDLDYAWQLADQRCVLQVHIKVDTGMHRLGERQENLKAIAQIFGLGTLEVKGIFTQLGCCDSAAAEDVAYTEGQLAGFEAVLHGLEESGIKIPAAHAQCSYGILNYPHLKYSYARPGLLLYTEADPACCLATAPKLETVFEVKAGVALVKLLHPGERAGYGQAHVANGRRQIATITMGYADGLPRALSGGRGRVLVRGRRAPIIGNVCMDQAIIDITGIEGVCPGDTVTIIGADGEDCITPAEMARWAGTIPNEIISRLGGRLERVYVGE